MNKILSIIALILCFGNVFVFAQTAEQTVTPNGLALEVTFFKGKPPDYMSISDSAAKPRWAWYSLFKRIPDFQVSVGKLPVRAVKFVPYLEDGAVKVKVSVLSGQTSLDVEESVVAYTMRENDRISVKGLMDFGVEPFEIALIRVTPSTSALPSIENKTTSLQVSAIETNFSTLPSFKMTLLNASDKAVSAFTFEMMENGRLRTSAMPHDPRGGEFVITPGGTLVKEMLIPLENKQPIAGEIPKPSNQQTIVISSVIFADGSYEGVESRASQFRAFTLGRKTQLKQIIALLESIESNSAAFNFAKFAEQASKLETKIGDAELSELAKRFPSLSEKEKSGMRGSAEFAANSVRKEFLNGMERYRQEVEPNVVRADLKSLKEKYQEWLSRLF
jgi:hypothetical protein